MTNSDSFYLKYKESCLRASHNYHRRNKKASAERRKRWRENNPDYYFEYRKTFRSKEHYRMDYIRRKLGKEYKNYETLEYSLVLRNDPCCYCGSPMEHIDHIDALSVGGLEVFNNLTAACRKCNSKKGNKKLLFFLLERK